MPVLGVISALGSVSFSPSMVAPPCFIILFASPPVETSPQARSNLAAIIGAEAIAISGISSGSCFWAKTLSNSAAAASAAAVS